MPAGPPALVDAGGLAVAIGPVTGGLLLEDFSWHAVYNINVPIVIVAVVAGLWLLPESRDPRALDSTRSRQ